MITVALSSTDPIMLPEAQMGDHVQCSNGVFRVVGTSRTGAVSLAPLPDQAQHRRGVGARARLKLAETDYVHNKAMDEGRTISDAWKDWRLELRRGVNGELDELPPEPPRWADAK